MSYKSYRQEDSFIRYKGFGLELGTFPFSIGANFPILNPKILWGKDYFSQKFSQWSINLLPVVGSVCLLGVALYQELTDSNSDIVSMEVFSAAALSSTIVEYTFGF